MTERVELHLHTTASEDTSVITPKDVIETAARLGHKAVAVTCCNSAQDFPELETRLRKYEKDMKVIYGAEVYYRKENTTYGIALLAKNKLGLKCLYRILSSMRKWENQKVVDWQAIADNRQNLLCGAMTWVASELEDTLENEHLYDYIAIIPSGHPLDRERQWQLYTNSSIPVVAVGNCHCVSEDDGICRKVVQWVKTRDYNRASTHYRTTRQMLQAVSYLGDTAAYEVVVTNSNLIANQIEAIFPSRGSFPKFALADTDRALRQVCWEKLKSLYGDTPPSLVVKRLEAELALSIQPPPFSINSSVYMLLHRLSMEVHKAGGYANVRGPLGSTLISCLLEISDINPLPAHYRCPACKHTEFIEHAASGYSLAQKACPVCGCDMRGDGHHIPHETFTCLAPEIRDASVEINIATSTIEKAWQFLIDHIGEHRIARAGCVATAGRGANEFVQAYQDSGGEVFPKEKADRITEKLKNIKVDEWSMPGSLLLLPEGMEFEDITPITQLAPPECGIYRRTHLDGHQISHVLQKVNLLGYKIYDRIDQLHRLCGTKPEDIDCSDPNILELFQRLDTNGIPFFSTASCKEIIGVLSKHRTDDGVLLRFADLVRILGMSFGINAWHNNAADLIRKEPLAELIGNRDDIFLKLRKYGVDPQTAFSVMETVRKGKFCADTDQNRETAQKLLAAGVPVWYVDSMRKIRYLSAKAHTAHYSKIAAVLAWFKRYYPEQFYNVTLRDLGAEGILHYTDGALKQKLEAFEKWDHSQDGTEESIALLLEARRRNIPIHL